MADAQARLTVSVVRPDDLVNLEVSCANLRLEHDEGGARAACPHHVPA